MVQNEQALEFALHYISLHNFITDRYTLLTGRLVCRAWRNSELFSGGITSVTLHRLADVGLATLFLPHKPSLRAPWRRIEDVFLFPNLHTLKLTVSLIRELRNSGNARFWLKQDCKAIDVELAKIEAFDLEELWQFLRRIRFSPFFGRLQCMSNLVISGYKQDSNPGEYGILKNVAILTGLTKLVLESCPYSYGFALRSLQALSRLKALRHLELQNVNVLWSGQVAKCFKLASTLTNLTRFDLSARVCDYPRGLAAEVENVLQGLAPRMLHTCKVDFKILDENRLYYLQLERKAFSMLRVVCKHVDVIVQASGNESVPSELLEVLECSPSPLFLGKRGEGGFPVDLPGVTAVEDLKAAFQYSCFEAWDPVRDIIPASIEPSAACVALLILDTSMERHAILTSGQLGQIFILPNVQHLRLFCPNSLSQLTCTSYLQQLTKLTELQVNRLATSDGYLTSFTYLPTSLKKLHICESAIKIPSFPALEHLESLRLDVLLEDVTAESLTACPAPLKELELFCLPHGLVDLHALASAFRGLEVLKLCISPCDVSPLSRLPVLWKLVLWLTRQEDPAVSGSFTGLKTLTRLQVLEVMSVERSHECLSDLAELTQLRHLRYLTRKENCLMSVTKDAGAFPAVSNRGASQWSEAVKQLWLKLPNTEIDDEKLPYWRNI